MGRAEDLFSRLETQGTVFIDWLISEAKAEEAFLDFKRSANHGASEHISDQDRKQLCKVLSGFANSDGGIVIWGIGTSKGGGDLAAERYPLEDCKAFAARLDYAISGCTVPPVPGVRSIPLAAVDGKSGFVATLIPASPSAPHQSQDGKDYMIRVGSSFQPAHHSVLAGLFGRKPQPTVGVSHVISPIGFASGIDGFGVFLRYGFLLVNTGPIVARDAFVSWRIEAMGGSKCRATLAAFEANRWQVDSINPRIGSCLARSENRLAPFSQQQGVTLQLNFGGLITEGFRMKLTAGCENAPPTHLEMNVETHELASLLARMENYGKSDIAHDDDFLQRMASDFIGVTQS